MNFVLHSSAERWIMWGVIDIREEHGRDLLLKPYLHKEIIYRGY